MAFCSSLKQALRDNEKLPTPGHSFAYSPLILWWLEGFTHLMTSTVLICIFWPCAECRTFLARIGQLRGKKKNILRAGPKLKFENCESVQHRLQFSGIKKGSKISFRRHFNMGRLRPKIQPLTLLYTLLYTIFAEKVPLLYNNNWFEKNTLAIYFIEKSYPFYILKNTAPPFYALVMKLMNNITEK